jgi:hypothetical protein
MFRDAASFLTKHFADFHQITGSLALVFAIIGLTHGSVNRYALPIALALGTLTLLTMLYNSVDWKEAQIHAATFAILGLTYFFHSGAYPNLHADTVWFILTIAAFLVPTVADWFILGKLDKPLRVANVLGLFALLVTCATPLIWGTGAVPMALVLACLAFTAWWSQTAIATYAGTTMSTWTFILTLVPLIVALVGYELNYTWLAGWVSAVAVLIVSFLIEEILNPQPDEHYGRAYA